MKTLKNQMGRMLMILSFVALFTLTACTTTGPDGTKVPDPVKTEKVKSVAETISTRALRRALARFPEDADQIALYAGSVGRVFCEMQATKKFNPEALEAGLSALVLPQVKDPEVLSYVTDGRDLLKLAYRQFFADRFNAELPPNEWPAVVADIFCNSINQALVDSGRPGIK